MYPGLTVVISCPGSAGQLWPLSLPDAPLELTAIAGQEQSLFDRAVTCSRSLSKQPLIITTTPQTGSLVRQHIAEGSLLADGSYRLVVERYPRGSALTLALVASQLKQRDPEAILLCLPVDLAFDEDDRWQQTVKRLYEAARQGYIAVVGTNNKIGHLNGCIKPGQALREVDGALKVRTYASTPSPSYIYRAMQQGAMWYAGIMAANASVLLAHLRHIGLAATDYEAQGAARIAETARFMASLGEEHWSEVEAKAVLETLPRISYADAVFENCQQLAVVPSSIEFKSWATLDELVDALPKDAQGNTLRPGGTATDARNTAVFTDAGKQVVVLGTDDLIVIDTADALLIAQRDSLGNLPEIITRAAKEA
jgi:mannose-1-phosphate guanylyltransferase/mannose-6-phosphate isomerase